MGNRCASKCVPFWNIPAYNHSFLNWVCSLLCSTCKQEKIIYSFEYKISFLTEVQDLSEKPRIDPEKAKEIRERAKERSLILREIKNQGSSTLDELAKATSIEKEKLFKHLITMRQFGKIAIVGERDNQLVYGLPEGEETKS